MGAEHFRKLERMYLAAPCNRHYEPRITISRGEAEVTIPIGPHLHHAAGAAHGSVYFKAIDDAAFFAVNSLVTDVFVLTVNLNLSLLRPISSGDLRAVGRVVFASRNFYQAEAVAYDSREREVARGSGLFVRSRIALSPDIGYR